MTSLTAFLSAPANASKLPPMPLAPPERGPLAGNSLTMKALAMKQEQAAVTAKSRETTATSNMAAKQSEMPKKSIGTMLKEREFEGLGDGLRSLKVESDLKRYIRDNIMHHRLVSHSSTTWFTLIDQALAFPDVPHTGLCQHIDQYLCWKTACYGLPCTRSTDKEQCTDGQKTEQGRESEIESLLDEAYIPIYHTSCYNEPEFIDSLVESVAIRINN